MYIYCISYKKNGISLYLASLVLHDNWKLLYFKIEKYVLRNVIISSWISIIYSKMPIMVINNEKITSIIFIFFYDVIDLESCWIQFLFKTCWWCISFNKIFENISCIQHFLKSISKKVIYLFIFLSPIFSMSNKYYGSKWLIDGSDKQVINFK